MSEEQFWRSNPRIIQVWEKGYKLEQKRKNELVHAWIGNYGISALMVAIDHCFNKKARSKYVTKPIELFEKTQEEIDQEPTKARQAFLAWAGMTKNKLKGKGENDG